MRKRLTESNVQAVPSPPRGKQQSFIWDTSTADLGIRTSKTKRAWVFRYSIQGRDRRLTLADLHELTLTEARQKAAELTEMIDRDKDPAPKRKAVTATAGETVEIEFPLGASGGSSRPTTCPGDPGAISGTSVTHGSA